MAQEKSKRDITQEAILALVADWESSCWLDFIDDLLNELDDEALAKVAQQQGLARHLMYVVPAIK